MNEHADDLIRAAARAMGRKGGLNRAKKLTPERRSEIARLGGLKRWAAKRKKKAEKKG